MPEVSFQVRADKAMESLLSALEMEDALEDCDMDINNEVFTLDFPDGAKLIINKQAPMEQLWLASPEGPAHFNYEAEQDEWVNDRTGEGLISTLERVLSDKTGETIRIELED